ncbi:MAG: rod shape-determining protein MreC [Bacillota bacterium]
MGSFFRKHRRFILVLVVLFLLLSFVNLVDYYRPESNWGTDIVVDFTGFFLGGISTVSEKISTAVTTLTNYRQVQQENKKLRQQVAKLEWKIQQLTEVTKENERLRRLLNFKRRQSFEVVGAKVIGKSAGNWSRLVTINRGRKDGLDSKMLVVTYGGNLVGRIKKVTTHHAQVLLLNDPNFTISGLVANRDSREIGIVKGTLAQRGLLEMQRLPWNAEVEIDDRVLTSGLSKTYPKGIKIGHITKVEPDDYGLTRLALVEPAVDLNTFEEVLVITGF